MPELLVTNELVDELISEVAPLVTEITHWELDTERLKVQVVPRERGYEEIALRHVQSLGVTVSEYDQRGILHRLMEYFIEANVLAAYLPAAEEIAVGRENVDDRNLDGLKVILGHELTHRSQHINHPNIYLDIERKSRALITELNQASGAFDFDGVKETINQIQELMTLMESHAAVVQQRLVEEYYPEAKIESHWNLATLLFSLLGAKKVSQYQDGVPMVLAAMQRGTIDSLFHLGR
jgi:hypothetical protein